MDIAEICKPVAKKTYQITDAASAPQVFAEAFRVAREGKPGVVVIDLPLAVCAAYKVPVIVVIVNNAYLGLIRQNQKYAYGYECDVAMPENQGLIDYVKVAEGFACYAERVFDADVLPAALARAKASGKPAVIDVVCDPQVDCSMGTALNNVKEFVY